MDNDILDLETTNTGRPSWNLPPRETPYAPMPKVKAPHVCEVKGGHAYDHGHLIVCAAVKYAEDDIVYHVRHGDCMAGRRSDGCVHGFLDNKRQFLTREEAYKVADAAGQIRVYPPKSNLEWHKEQGTEPGLFSELVW